jgi:CHAT domain-containing protein
VKRTLRAASRANKRRVGKDGAYLMVKRVGGKRLPRPQDEPLQPTGFPPTMRGLSISPMEARALISLLKALRSVGLAALIAIGMPSIGKADDAQVIRQIRVLEQRYGQASRAGDDAAAERFFEEAVLLARRHLPATDATLAQLLEMRSYTLMAAAKAAAAIPLLHQSLAIREGIPGRGDGPAPALMTLAQAYEELGRFESSEAMWRRMAEIDRPDNGRSLMSLGEFLVRRERHADAAATYRQAFIALLAQGGRRALATAIRAYGAWAVASVDAGMKLGDWEPGHRQVEQFFDDIKDDKTWFLTGYDRALAEFALIEAETVLELAGGSADRALAVAESAVATVASRPSEQFPQLTQALSNLARVHRAREEWPQYSAAIQRKIEATYAIDGRVLDWRIEHVKTWRELARGRLKERKLLDALAAFRNGVAVASLPQNRDRLGADIAIYADYVHTFLEASMAGVSNDELTRGGFTTDAAFKALQWAQRTTAARAVAQAKARASGSPAAASLIRRRELALSQVQSAEQRLTDALTAPVRDQAAIGRLRQAVITVTQDIETLDREIAATLPRYAELADPAPLSLADVRTRLKDDEALLIVLSREPGIVLAVSHTHTAWNYIRNPDQAANAALRLRCSLDATAPSCPRPQTGDNTSELPPFDFAAAHELYREIFGMPISQAVDGKRHIFVVADGPFAALPFQVLLKESLPRGMAGLAALKSAHWLIRDYSVSLLPAVSTLAMLRAPRDVANDSRKPFLGFGDPAIGDGGPMQCPDDTVRMTLVGGGSAVRASQINSDSMFRSGPIVEGVELADVAKVRSAARLADTRCELFRIARSLGGDMGDVFLDAAATETRVKTMSRSGRLAEFKVVSFATHGLTAGEIGAAEPALVLTPPIEATREDDGLLTASEITTLDLNADWVILSACNTADGENRQSESLSGLARSFFYAGARSLLVSHWRVISDAAVGLTTHTIEALAATPAMGRARALRQAMLSTLDGADDEVTAHPAYWAPFSLVGAD